MIIERLKLYTAKPEEQWQFYTETLGFGGNKISSHAFELLAGETLLAFEESGEEPYYHFAFNIPSYQPEEALEWLRDKVDILKDGEEELIDFSNWNAYAMYFSDPAGNIVEFIARRDLDRKTEAPFTTESILSVSEIGLPVEEVETAFRQLEQEAGVPFYSGNKDDFCAAGDPQGLFIIVDHQNKEWYPTDIPARSFPLDVVFREQGRRHFLSLSEAAASVH